MSANLVQTAAGLSTIGEWNFIGPGLLVPGMAAPLFPVTIGSPAGPAILQNSAGAFSLTGVLDPDAGVSRQADNAANPWLGIAGAFLVYAYFAFPLPPSSAHAWLRLGFCNPPDFANIEAWSWSDAFDFNNQPAIPGISAMPPYTFSVGSGEVFGGLESVGGSLFLSAWYSINSQMWDVMQTFKVFF